MAKSSICCAIVGCLIAAAQVSRAGPLDAPVNAAPTVGSEIKQGYRAAPNCESGMDADVQQACFAEVRARAAIARPDATAFDIGLEVREWERADLFIRAADNLPGNLLAERLRIGAVLERINAYGRVTSSIIGLKLSVSDVFDLLDISAEERGRWEKTFDTR